MSRDLIDRKHFDNALQDVLVVASAKMALGEEPKIVNELTLQYISQVREWLAEEPSAIDPQPTADEMFRELGYTKEVDEWDERFYIDEARTRRILLQPTGCLAKLLTPGGWKISRIRQKEVLACAKAIQEMEENHEE